MGIIGVIIIVLFSYLICNNKKKINYQTVGLSFLLLVGFALFVLVVPIGVTIIQAIANGIVLVLEQGQNGIAFLFGDLANVDKNGFVFAIKVLGNIIFFASLISLLYYLKIMPIIINTLTSLLTRLIKTSRPETMSAISTIFVGPGEAQIAILPFMKNLSRSEIFSIMVSGMTAIAGSVMAGYIGMGMSAKYIVSATFMSIPSSLFFSKLIFPETEKTVQTYAELKAYAQIDAQKSNNIIEAISHGAITGLKIAAIIGAMLIAFISLVSLANVLLGHIGNLFHYQGLSLSRLLGWILSPVAYIMGVPAHDIIKAGGLIGTKTITNEFVAFAQLSKELNTISPKTQAIVTFALCGFANFSTLGIIIGSIQVLAPNRVKEFSRLAFKALLAATMANLMNGCLAGIMFDIFHALH